MHDRDSARWRRAPGRPAALVVLCLVAALAQLGATNCTAPWGEGSDDPAAPAARIEITLNAIPADQNALLVVPPSGFTVDVRFPDPSAVDPATLWIATGALDRAEGIPLTGSLVRSDPDGAVAVVPPGAGLRSTGYAVVVRVDDVWGGAHTATLEFAVREPRVPLPLEAHQWIQLDFAADRDGDGYADLSGDLEAFGLGSASAPGLSAIVEGWVVDEIVVRTQEFYDTPNPSDLPGGDAANLTFSADPPGAGPYTRICVGGEDPAGGVTIGNVLYDAGNTNPGDVACDDFLPSGVFPREILYWSSEPVFQDAFGALLAEPVGSHPLDATVLGPSYDPGDPAQLARLSAIERGVAAFAQVVATITAHEAGHALGLVPPGEPGGGLFGGAVGLSYTHNLTPEGIPPAESFLMNAGHTFSFSTLCGDPDPLPRLRELNWAYLHGRLLLDSRIDGVYPPPFVESVDPTTVSLSGPTWVPVSVFGRGFVGTPALRLLGPVAYSLSSPELVDSTQATGGIVTFQVLEGTYDLEYTNGDGQEVLRPQAVTVVP